MIREHAGVLHRVTVGGEGFEFDGQIFASLSAVARAITGVRWNGRRFFALDSGPRRRAVAPKGREQDAGARRDLDKPIESRSRLRQPMTASIRCAIYTRVSTDAGLEQDFNSLDAQREAARPISKAKRTRVGVSCASASTTAACPAGPWSGRRCTNLLIDVRERRIDVMVVYKVDRLTRSLADFAKLVEVFDAHGVAFVSVTQSFNTTTSMGRLTSTCCFVRPVRAGGDRRAHS